MRIFPGKISPGDLQAATRRTVELVATIAPAVPDLAGEAVYFKVWDVDDPFDQLHAGMADVNLIDANASGPDNRPPPGEAPVSLTGSIDPAGQEARVTFTVSMQPGNNYRAGASCLQDAVSDVQADQTTADAINEKNPAAPGAYSGYDVPLVWSQMLTVWRKLTLEVDSMDREGETWALRFPAYFEQDRCVVVSATVDAPNAGLTTIVCGEDPDPLRAGFAGENFFEGGAFWCSDGGPEFLIVRSAAGPNSYTLTILGDPGAGIVGQECRLRDDDLYNGAGTGQLPLTTVLDQHIRNAYRDAYIGIVEANSSLNLVNLVDWVSHLSPAQLIIDYYGLTGVSYQWDVPGQSAFWARHFVVCYQSDRGNSGDGDGEENCNISENCPQVFAPYGVLGLSALPQLSVRFGLTVRNEVLFDTALSTVYVETIRDLHVTPTSPVLWQFVAHEAGHKTLDLANGESEPDAEHAEGGLMSSGDLLQDLPQFWRFTGRTIKRFREVERW